MGNMRRAYIDNINVVIRCQFFIQPDIAVEANLNSLAKSGFFGMSRPELRRGFCDEFDGDLAMRIQLEFRHASAASWTIG
jgi:hypothetical protein